jgi:hypothetical protein
VEAEVAVEREEDLPAALEALGLAQRRPVLVVVGGAGSLGGAELDALAPCGDALVRAGAAAGAAIVDGGTDAGVMRLVGRAREAGGAGVPLVGVVVRSLARSEAELEPRHTHFVLVPGSDWGDEAPWQSVAAGRPVLAVAGSGGTADGLAAAARGAPADERAAALAASGLVEPFDLREDRRLSLEQRVGEMLGACRTADAR